MENTWMVYEIRINNFDVIVVDMLLKWYKIPSFHGRRARDKRATGGMRKGESMPKKAVSVGKLEKWVRSSEGKKVLAKAYKVAKKSSAEYAKASTINLEVLARPFTR